jgi:hypothetical protein
MQAGAENYCIEAGFQPKNMRLEIKLAVLYISLSEL